MPETTPRVELMLPEVPAEPTFIYQEQKFLTLGPAGCGKSGFWAEDPDAFFFDTEGNLSHLRVMKLPCRSWQDFRDIVSLLTKQKQEGKLKYKIVHIDTFDRWLAYCEQEVIRMAKIKYKKAVERGLEINTIGDVPDGNGWSTRLNMIMNGLEALHQLGVAVSIIGHTQEKKIEEPTRKLDKWTINVGGQLGSQVLGWSNHTLSIESRLVGTELQRIVHTLPKDTREAKSHGARIPDGWKWSSKSEDNYKKLRSLFT